MPSAPYQINGQLENFPNLAYLTCPLDGDIKLHLYGGAPANPSDPFLELVALLDFASPGHGLDYHIRQSGDAARSIIAYAKLHYRSVEENLKEWALVRLAGDLDPATIGGFTALKPGLVNPINETIEKLRQEIQTKLVELSKRVIQTEGQTFAKNRGNNP